MMHSSFFAFLKKNFNFDLLERYGIIKSVNFCNTSRSHLYGDAFGKEPFLCLRIVGQVGDLVFLVHFFIELH
jgi:hypothetical protein